MLLERLAEFGDQPALVWQEREYSYRHLLDAVVPWRAHLDASGIGEGESVAVQGCWAPEVCSLLLALILHRNVIVPISPVARDVDTELEVAHVRTLFRFTEDGTWSAQRRSPANDHPLLQSLREAHEPGLVLFTSGSAGARKAALLSFPRLLERFEKRRRSLRTLLFMELDHIGGINTLLHGLCDGGLLVPARPRTPQAVAQAIERHQVQLLPTTPTFLNMLLVAQVHQEYDLSALELITYGTEPMPASTLRALNQAFPRVRLKQTYGLSELGILATASKDSQSLWLRLGGGDCETKIVDGTLWIRTRSAMLGYLNAASPFDAEGWFNTGDAVETEGDYLRILGRVSEAINVGGEKVYPAEVESVLLQMDNIREVTVYGKANAMTGNVVIATVRLCQPEEPEQLERRLWSFCQSRLPEYKIPVLVQIDDTEQHGPRFKKLRQQSGKGVA